MIAGRTKTALATGRAKVKLGSPNIEAAQEASVAVVKAEADRAAGNVLAIITEIQRSGATTLQAIADALNARGVSTARGGRWHAMSVRTFSLGPSPARRAQFRNPPINHEGDRGSGLAPRELFAVEGHKVKKEESSDD